MAAYPIPSATPSSLHPSVELFLSKYFETCDQPNAHDAWADAFAPTAVLILGRKKFVGHDEILAFGKGLWDTVDSQYHTVGKVFAGGDSGHEIMLYGHVTSTSKSGEGGELDWAVRAKLQGLGEDVKFAFYQVYLESY